MASIRGLRATLSSLRAANETRARVTALERREQVNAETIEALRAGLASVADLADQVEALRHRVDGLHQALVDADPQMSLDIVTAVRDDVRRLLVEITEAHNRAAAAIGDRPAGAGAQG